MTDIDYGPETEGYIGTDTDGHPLYETRLTGPECDGDSCDEMEHRYGCSLYVSSAAATPEQEAWTHGYDVGVEHGASAARTRDREENATFAAVQSEMQAVVRLVVHGNLPFIELQARARRVLTAWDALVDLSFSNPGNLAAQAQVLAELAR